ncbi:MAG: DUF393 domain-containing protein [Pseudomonadota bacterium]
MASKPENDADGPDPVTIIYDGECPFCSAYVSMVRLRDAVGPVRLVDAREGGLEVEAVRAAGLDLDEGMVMIHRGTLYHGADCIHRIGLMSTASGALNRLNAWIFRSPGLSRALYPLLRAGRNLALKLLGRRKISGGRF